MPRRRGHSACSSCGRPKKAKDARSAQTDVTARVRVGCVYLTLGQVDGPPALATLERVLKSEAADYAHTTGTREEEQLKVPG